MPTLFLYDFRIGIYNVSLIGILGKSQNGVP